MKRNVLCVILSVLLLGLPVYAAEGLGDANADGSFDAQDAVTLQQWLLGNGALENHAAADFSGDSRLTAADLSLMKRALAYKPSRSVRVTNTEELKAALADAQPGDEIIAAAGTYVYSGSTPKGRMFTGEADGTEAAPILLRGEDPDDPPVISGINQDGSYALTILGDWWELRDLKVTNASKGIIVDHADHTKILRCEVYDIGMEGIHFRDNSSYCLAEDCYVHDTGTRRPGFGEAVYIGSAKSTTDYGHQCDYNTVRGCRLGPNVAAEHIDVKEYTTGTLIEDCVFDGTGMSGENYADSFVDIKGNDCILRRCTGYRNGCEQINRAFELNCMDEGWGRNALIYGNKAYMDTATNALGKKMVLVNSWDCSETVWGNFIAYEDGVLLDTDDQSKQWTYFNCNDLTYGDPSMEAALGR